MTMDLISRRAFLNRGLAAGVGLGMAGLSRASAQAGIEVADLRVISLQPNLYHGWPTVACCENGQLIVAYSGSREGHVCPFGRAEIVRSHDNGETWTWPQVVGDSVIDDRDAGVLETRSGALLVTSFTSLAYEGALNNAIAAEGAGWDPGRFRRWKAAHARTDAEGRKRALGVWAFRSTDGGLTWSERIDSLVNSPHGPIQLSDGRLLYAGCDLWRPGRKVAVAQSLDDGISWELLSEIEPREGDEAGRYHELHAVEASDGRIVVQIRNHNTQNDQETLQCESEDGGKTWSKPRAIGVWGLPSHLLRLADGRLLMTYGHRRKPFGNQARVSEDGGRSWSEPLALSADGIGGDLGYPSTAQLQDGSLVSVWYEVMAGSGNAVLRQARWRLT
jgi:sialidase-1